MADIFVQPSQPSQDDQARQTLDSSVAQPSNHSPRLPQQPDISQPQNMSQQPPQMAVPPNDPTPMQPQRPAVRNVFQGYAGQAEQNIGNPQDQVYQQSQEYQKSAQPNLQPSPQEVPQYARQQAPQQEPQQPPLQDNSIYDDYYDDAFPDLFPGMPRPIAEELLYEWQAPSRPFKQRNKQFFTTTATIALLISLILFFAGQWIGVVVVGALVFLVYVFTTIPPQTVTNQITTYGIRMENELYYWDELGWFWFTQKYDDEMVNVEVGRFPHRLTLLLGKADKELIRLIFSEILLENQPPLTYYERISAWLQEKIPLDIDG